MFEPLPAWIELRQSRVRALAVQRAARSPPPDLPAIGDFVPGYEASAVPVSCPRNTPPEIIATLNAAINAASAIPR